MMLQVPSWTPFISHPAKHSPVSAGAGEFGSCRFSVRSRGARVGRTAMLTCWSPSIPTRHGARWISWICATNWRACSAGTSTSSRRGRYAIPIARLRSCATSRFCMPLGERDRALLYDMLDAARHLQKMWQHRSIDELLNDRTLQWATDRGFNIIGEAARRLSDAVKLSHPDIEWRRRLRAALASHSGGLAATDLEAREARPLGRHIAGACR